MHHRTWLIRLSSLALLGAALAANPGKLLSIYTAAACTVFPSTLQEPSVAASKFIVLQTQNVSGQLVVRDAAGAAQPAKTRTFGQVALLELETAPSIGSKLTVEFPSPRPSVTVWVTAPPAVDPSTLRLETNRYWTGKTCIIRWVPWSDECARTALASADSVETSVVVKDDLAAGLIAIENSAVFKEPAAEYCVDARFWDTFGEKEITVRRCVKEEAITTPDKPTSFECPPEGAAGSAGSGAGSGPGGAPTGAGGDADESPVTSPGTGGKAPSGTGGTGNTAAPAAPESAEAGGCSLGVAPPASVAMTLAALVAGWVTRRRRARDSR